MKLFVLLLLFPTLLAGVTLVEEGAPRAVLVIPDNPKPAETLAAEELRYHLREASGAALPIIAEKDAARHPGARVYLGNTRAARAAGLHFPQPERFAWDPASYPWAGREIGGALYFCGVDGEGSPTGPETSRATHDSEPLGTLFAVYDFLERECGVRWIWPGKTGEVIPPRATIEAPEGYAKNGQPRFINANWRVWSAYNGRLHGWAAAEDRDCYLREQRQWLTRQRFRRLSPLAGSEGFFNYGGYRARYPEIVAMTPDGKRGRYYETEARAVKGFGWSRVAMCVSNPQTPVAYYDFWKSRIPQNGKWANTHVVGMMEADIPAYCICEGCRAWDAKDPRFATHPYWNGRAGTPTTVPGMWQTLSVSDPGAPSLTDRYAKFWLAALETARQEDPHARLWTYAYLNYRHPPVETKLNEGVIVGLVGWPYLGWPKGEEVRLNQEWDQWRATGASLLLRPNTTLTGHNLPAFYARPFAAAFAHAARNGLLGTDIDSLTGQWGAQGPTLYTIGRLHSHPEQPVESILDEFYSAFGPAKEAVEAYFTHWENLCANWTEADRQTERDRFRQEWEQFGSPRISRVRIAATLFTPEAMAKGRGLLDKIKATPVDDPEVATRVAVLEAAFLDAEQTLQAVRYYDTYLHERSLSNRLALDRAVATLDTARKERSRTQPQNISGVSAEEHNLWSPAALEATLGKKSPGTAADVDAD